jgi:hypothetical protein
MAIGDYVDKAFCPAGTRYLRQQITVTTPIDDVNPPKLWFQRLQFFLRILSGLMRVDEKALGKVDVAASRVVVRGLDAPKASDVKLYAACVWIVAAPPVL